MKQLPPVVAGVDGNVLKLKTLEDIDFEFLGYLLTCHLVIEHHLDEFLATLGTRLRWDAAKLTFSQKLALFPVEIFPRGGEMVAAIKHPNGLRNKVAHSIKARGVDLNYKPLSDFLRLAYDGKRDVPTEPIAILEDFSSLVCSGLIGWVASDAYRTSWRNERDKPVEV
ncbi:hypothetical protein [Paraburkholderia fungorum]|uniref:hypothetical protein n=1 Tax=Paraburkholderia fungorum TaxID=134537 RepID=UPI001C1F1E67|nr:hypothetical protein [Paraburkholderia fungorum]MBU7442161.1 hypothetical protein [Paraburkholderia fungorum]